MTAIEHLRTLECVCTFRKRIWKRIYTSKAHTLERYIRSESIPTRNSNFVRAVDWDNSEAESRNMCLIIIFQPRPYNERPPQAFKSPLNRWMHCKFPHFFDDYDMLSDKPSQSSPLDVAPVRICLLGEQRKQFSFPKQPEALLHTLHRHPSISQISIRLDWF